MTTIIRAIGANFSNVDLSTVPVIPTEPTPPPTTGSLVLDGLVAAFRPSNATNGLTDLSGNGHTLTAVGAPTLTATDMYGTVKNGYRTDVKETVSLTYIVVHKVITKTDAKSVAIGSYNATLIKGTSIVTESPPMAKAYVHLKGPAEANTVNNITFNAAAGEYYFAAITIDAVAGTVKTYVPNLSATDRSAFTTTTAAVANRLLNDVNFVALCIYPETSRWAGESHIAEALIYDKALTAEQIMQQYQLSQAVMAERGITI